MPFMGERTEGNSAVRAEIEGDWALKSAKVVISEDILQRAAALQREHSSFSDPEDAWNRIYLYDEEGETLHVVTLGGY